MKRNLQTKASSAPSLSNLSSSFWVIVGLCLATGVGAVVVFQSSFVRASSGAKAIPQATGADEVTAFGPTIPNKIAPPSPTPNGMVWIPGGEFSMGAMDPPAVSEVGMHEAVDARPILR